VSEQHDYERAIEAMGYSIVGHSGSGHLVVEHATKGIRLQAKASPGGGSATANSLARLRRALERGARDVDVFLDWLCHEYEVGSRERKTVHVNLLNEASRWAHDEAAPKRAGRVPNVESVARMARNSERLLLVKASHGRARGRLSIWSLAGARYDAAVLTADEPGSHRRPKPPPEHEVVGQADAARGPVDRIIVGGETLGAAEPADVEPAVNGSHATAEPVSPADLAAIVGPLRAALLPEIAARDELVVDELRALAAHIDAEIEHLTKVGASVRHLLALHESPDPGREDQ